VFDHFVWSVLTVPAIVVLALWAFGDRIRPDLAAPAFAWAAVVAAGASALNLLALTVKALVEISAFGDWSSWAVVSVYLPWVALVWVLVLARAVVLQVRRYSRAMRSARRRAGAAGEEVVVIGDARIDAFALPGRPGRIVVTTGMRDALDEAGYSAVIAHERAHLVRSHHRLVWLAGLAAAVHPVLTPVARKVEYLVERAADEEAARELGDRKGVAMAICVAALAAAARPFGARVRGVPLTALGTSGAVPGRVQALLQPARGVRWPVFAPVLLALSTVVWTGECFCDVVDLFALVRDPGR
jgi:Zn-dependent protease with chaperone function